MKKTFLFLLIVLSIMQTHAQGKFIAIPATSPNSIIQKDNPFLQQWDTPYQTPPFNLIKLEHYMPAFEFGIAEAKKDIDIIKSNREVPNFNNTIVALDRAGYYLSRVSGIFFNLIECDATPEMQELANKVQPLVTQYSNDLYLDTALFTRVKYVYDHEYNSLNSTTDRMLLKKTYDAFVNNGANLSPADKKRFNELSIELSNLTLQFGQNALAATNDYQMNILKKSELKGLPENELAIAKSKAQNKGLKGYLFDLSYPSSSAILKYADNRNLRKEMFLHSCNKSYQGKYDNSNIIRSILQCRNEIAHLLGYENYAQYALHDCMAENTDNVYKLLDQLKEASLPVAVKEMQSLNEYAHSIGFKDNIERWDLSYYSEKQQKKLFNLNTEDLKPYFKLENVIDGVFSLAKTLYGLTFEPDTNIQTYQKDVMTYDVFQKGKFKAVLYLDFYPRDTKRAGAWMTSFREQYVDASGQDVRPLVSLVTNFTPSTPGHPSLLSFYEVTTFLHEFGHALNGMLSEVPYISLSGTNSQHDFVEMPSQMNENWATEPDFLKTFAHHYKTGELIPESYIDQLKAIRNYQAGYNSVRQLSFGYLDMMWHTIDPNTIGDIKTLERKVFDELEVLPKVQEACMSTSFNHIFSGGYAAGYYGYKWAEVLEADAFSLFQEEGVMNPKVADKYVECILSKGGSEPAAVMFSNFRGRDPKIDALLKKTGLR